MRLRQWQDTLADAVASPSAAENAAPGIHVYRNNCRQALLSALRKTYPTCLAIVGPECFTDWAQAFIHRHPMRHMDMNRYGQQFPEHLQQLMQQARGKLRDALQGLEYLADLAQLEWQLQNSYYAADTVEAYSLTDLAGLSETEQGQAQLLLSADVSLLQSCHPLYEIWLRHRSNDPKIELCTEKTDYYYAIYRQDYQALVTQITHRQFLLLRAVEQQQSLADLIRQQGPLDSLTELIQRGWIAGYRPPRL